MALLNKNQILANRPAIVETIAVPEWGGEVSIRRMSGNLRDEWDMFNINHRDPTTGRLREDTKYFRATLVAKHLCDEQGRLLDFSPEEVMALGEDDGAVLDRIYDRCVAISDLAANAVKNSKKNSEPAPSDASGTCSPEP